MTDKEAPPPVTEERIEDIIDVCACSNRAHADYEGAVVDCPIHGEKQDEPGDTTQG